MEDTELMISSTREYNPEAAEYLPAFAAELASCSSGMVIRWMELNSKQNLFCIRLPNKRLSLLVTFICIIIMLATVSIVCM